MVANLRTRSYEVIDGPFPEDCPNHDISSVQVVPNRPGEIVYVLNRSFYDELGECRKRHDLVHLNLNTGVENVLLIDW